MPTRLAELVRLLERAGAPDPMAWAKSEGQEDIPQLARFLFLRQAWRAVVSEGDTTWIDHNIANPKHNAHAPGASMGPALERALLKGCSRDDLTQIARTAQWEVLHSICYLLSDPSIEEPELSHIAWSLVEVRPDGSLGRQIGGLHESVLQ